MQGFILSPLLFNLFVRNLSTIYQHLSRCSNFIRTLITPLRVQLIITTPCRFFGIGPYLFQPCSKIIELISNRAKPRSYVCIILPRMQMLTWHSTCILLIALCCIQFCPSCLYQPCPISIGIIFDEGLSRNLHLPTPRTRLKGISCLLYDAKVFLLLPLRRIIANCSAYTGLRDGTTPMTHAPGMPELTT